MSDQGLVPVTAYARHTAVTFVGVTVPMLVLAFATLGARLHPRVRPAWHFSWDDGFIVAGAMLTLAEWGITMAAVYWCVGGSPPQFTSTWRVTHTTKLGYLAIPVWACAITSIKLSIICLLLRFPHGLAWKTFLYIMMVVQAFFAIGNVIFLLAVQCRPLVKAWDFTHPGVCLGARAIRIASNTSSYTNIATDLILSLIPLTFLGKLKGRPVQERILVSVLMAAGLAASAMSIKKMFHIRQWGRTEDIIGLEYAIELWTCLELFLGLIAACLPCLKSGCQRVITRCGVVFNTHLSMPTLRSVFIATQASNRNHDSLSKESTMIPKEANTSSNHFISNTAYGTTLDPT